MSKIPSIVIGMLFAAFCFFNANAIETPTVDPLSELQLSEAEKINIENFISKYKNSEDFLKNVLDEAHDGNQIAMYITGQCSLSGMAGTTINKGVANLHFAMAASLGYAPALFQIFQMYINENQDPFLALVYLNLTISLGHTEYREIYYSNTEKLSQTAGKLVVANIERIALEKIIEIQKTRAFIKERKDTWKPALSLISKNITSSDSTYNEGYWKKYFDTRSSWGQFFGRSITDEVKLDTQP